MADMYTWSNIMDPSYHSVSFIVPFLAVAAVLVGYFLFRFDGTVKEEAPRVVSEKEVEELVTPTPVNNQYLVKVGYYPFAGMNMPFLRVHPDILGGCYIACRGLQISLFLPVIAVAAQLFSLATASQGQRSSVGKACENLVLVLLGLSGVISIYTLFTARFLAYFGHTSSQSSSSPASPPRIIRLLLIALFDSASAAALSFVTLFFATLVDFSNTSSSITTTRHGVINVDEWLNAGRNLLNIKMLGVLIIIESLLLSISSLAAMGQSLQWYADLADSEKDGVLRVGVWQVVEVRGNGDIKV